MANGKRFRNVVIAKSIAKSYRRSQAKNGKSVSSTKHSSSTLESLLLGGTIHYLTSSSERKPTTNERRRLQEQEDKIQNLESRLRQLEEELDEFEEDEEDEEEEYAEFLSDLRIRLILEVNEDCRREFIEKYMKKPFHTLKESATFRQYRRDDYQLAQLRSERQEEDDPILLYIRLWKQQYKTIDTCENDPNMSVEDMLRGIAEAYLEDPLGMFQRQYSEAYSDLEDFLEVRHALAQGEPLPPLPKTVVEDFGYPALISFYRGRMIESVRYLAEHSESDSKYEYHRKQLQENRQNLIEKRVENLSYGI